MKILQLGKFYYPVMGGVETVEYDMAEVLNMRGITCDVLCTNIENSTIYEKINGYNVFRASSFGEFFSTAISLSYIRILKEIINNYDVIHVHLPNPLANIALMLCNTNDKKIVVHWHSDIIKQKYLLKIYRPFQTWLLNRADVIIGTSIKYLNESKELVRYTEKCHPVPIGIDTLRLKSKPELLDKLRNQFPEKKIVFTLGRHVYYKGFEYLIDAAKYLNDEYIILIGGVGPLFYELKIKIDDNGLNDKVRLLGRIEEEDLGSYYELCDLFCLPSILKSEAFGVVQIEAMSFGKPVVATKINGSGTSWVNEDNISGINVDIMDAHGLAEAIKYITGDETRYHKFSSGAKKRFKLHFERNVMLDKIIDIYSSFN